MWRKEEQIFAISRLRFAHAIVFIWHYLLQTPHVQIQLISQIAVTSFPKGPHL